MSWLDDELNGTKTKQPSSGASWLDEELSKAPSKNADVSTKKLQEKTPIDQRLNLLGVDNDNRSYLGMNIIPAYKEDTGLAKLGKGIVNYGVGGAVSLAGNVFNASQQALMQGTRAAGSALTGKPQNFSEMTFGKDILGAKKDNLLTTAIALGLDPATYVGGGILDDLSRAGQFGRGAVKGSAENLIANAATGQRAAKGLTPSAQTATKGYLNAERNALKKDAIKTPDIIFSGKKAGQTTDDLNRLALPAGKQSVKSPLLLPEGSSGLALPERAASKIELGGITRKAKEINPADIYVDQYGQAAASPNVFPTNQLRLPAGQTAKKTVTKRIIDSPNRVTPREAKKLGLDLKSMDKPMPAGAYSKTGTTDVINQIQPRANAAGLEPNMYAKAKGQIEKPLLPLQRKLTPPELKPDYSLGKGRVDDINAPLASKALQKEAVQPKFKVNTAQGTQVVDTTKFTDSQGKTVAKALQGDEVYENITKELQGTSVKSDSAIKNIAPTIKDKSGLSLNLKDVYRNMRDAFGKSYEHIKKNYLDPLDASKGAYADEVKKYTDDIYNNVVKKLGINKDSKESAAVQWFGEKKRIADIQKTVDPQTGKKLNKAIEAPYTIDDLKKDFPDKWQSIVEADKIFRKTYDELIDKVNTTVSKIYPNNVEKIVPKRTDYYRHFNEMAQGFEGLKNIFDTPAQIDPKLAGISEFLKPKSKWASFKQKRGLGAYKADAVGGFLDYIQPAAYSIHIDPNISKFRGLAKDIAEATTDTKNANGVISYLNDFANSLAGKTNWLDRFPLKLLGERDGRTVMSVLNWTNSRIKANQVLGNTRSVIAQTANIPAGIARINDPGALAKGIGDTLANIVGKGNRAINQSNFIKERYMQELLNRFNTKIIDQPQRFAAWVMSGADQLGTNFIWNSAYRKFEGAADAIKKADDLTRSIVAGRGIAEVPLLQQSKVFQLVAPFQLEVANLWHVMGDMVKEKDFGGIVLLMLGNYLFNEAAEKLTGSGVVFDPIGAMQDALSEDDITPLGIAGRLGGEVLSNIPLGQTIATAFPEYESTLDLGIGKVDIPSRQQLFGRNDPTRYGSGLLVAKGIQDPLYKILPPFGGAQIKKTKEGLESFSKGAVEKDGKMRFPIEQTPKKLAQSALFGQYSTPEAREYFDKNRRPLSEKQTKQVGTSKAQYELLMRNRKIDTITTKIKEVQKDLKLTPEARSKKLNELYKQLQNVYKSE